MGHGFWPAVLVQLGSLSGDIVWAAVALTGTAFLIQNRPLTVLLGVAGGCFLLCQVFVAFRGASRGGLAATAAPPSRGDFLTGSFFSLTNPFAVAFWLGLGAGVTASAHNGFTSTITFFVGFFLGGGVLVRGLFLCRIAGASVRECPATAGHRCHLRHNPELRWPAFAVAESTRTAFSPCSTGIHRLR